MKNKKNILHVVNIYFTIPYFLGKQILYFVKKGYSVNVVCSPSEQLKEYSVSHNFDYREIEITRKISLWQDIVSIISVCKYIKEKEISIVTGHTPKGALIAMISAFIMRVPIRIYFRHGLVYETATGIKRKVLIFIDRLAALLSTKIVCVSPSVFQKSLDNRLNGREKQVLLSKGTCNGIDVNRFDPHIISVEEVNLLREKLLIPKDCFVIGYTGRLVRDKGIIELIDGFIDIQKNYTNVILLLVGMLEERDALPTSVVFEIKNNKNIISTGYVDNSLIEKYYALMDIFILPSYREGFPTSVLEASSMKIPVITTRATGCVDSIIEEETGVFVKNDAKDIANAIISLVENETKRKLLGRTGRKYVIDNFNQKLIWEEIAKLYI